MNTILFINDLGTTEFLIITFIIILFFGPDKIPEFARSLGNIIRKLNEFKANIKKEIISNSKKKNNITKTKNDIENETKNIQRIKGTIKRV